MVFREKEFLKLTYKSEDFLIVSDSEEFVKAAIYLINESWPWLTDVTVCTVAESINLQQPPAHCLYYADSVIPKSLRGNLTTIEIITNTAALSQKNTTKLTQFLVPEINQQLGFSGITWIVGNAIRACFSFQNVQLVIPKFWSVNDNPFNDFNLSDLPSQDYLISDFESYLCFQTKQGLDGDSSRAGSRAQVLCHQIQMSDLLQPLISEQQLSSMQQKLLKKHRLAMGD
jgi:hypothetical protein